MLEKKGAGVESRLLDEKTINLSRIDRERVLEVIP